MCERHLCIGNSGSLLYVNNDYLYIEQPIGMLKENYILVMCVCMCVSVCVCVVCMCVVCVWCVCVCVWEREGERLL